MRTLGNARRSACQRLQAAGYGLLELAIGLVLVSAILAGVMLFFQTASDNARASETIEQVLVVTSIMDEFRDNIPPTTSGLATEDYTETFRDMGLFPAKWTTLIWPVVSTPFKTPLLVSASTQNALENFYIIGLPGLPEAGCRAALTKDYGRSLQYIFVRSIDNGVPGFINRRAATPDEAALYCKGGAYFLNLRFIG